MQQVMLSGKILSGRYRIIRFITNGGMGEVYLAEDLTLNREVVVKTIIPKDDPDKHRRALRRFRDEIRAIAKLDNPHILPLFDYGQDSINNIICTYMVMPYRQDGTLSEWLKRLEHLHAPFPALEDISYILDQAAAALQDAHDHDILHRDVKPSNFLILDNKVNPHRPYLLLADFGVAKFLDEASGNLTGEDDHPGTIDYMPVEQLRNRPNPASDQYALAIMMYELLTYQRPFQGAVMNLQYQHQNVSPKPPSILNPGIPPEIDAVIAKALAKDHEQRYPSVMHFAYAFKQALVNNATKQALLSEQERIQQIKTVSEQVKLLQAQAASNQQDVTRLQQLVQVLQNSQAGYRDVLKQLQQLLQKKSTTNTNSVTTAQKSFIIIISLLILILIVTSISSLFYNLQTHSTLLNIEATANAITDATATVKAISTLSYPSYLPGHGTIALHDSLDGANNYDNWDTTSNDCSFTNRVYDVSSNSSVSPFLQACLDTATSYNNFAIEVTMTINSGNCGGIVFGSNSSSTNYYTFQICADGNHFFPHYDGANLISNYNDFDPNVNKGLNQTNTLAIFANGNNISFYVNHQLVYLPDGTYFIKNRQGYLGVLAADYNQPVTDISYTNINVWTLP